MARKSAKDKVSNEVNAGSMADIAFLLLIFFLVTTTMDQDKGLLVKLPPWSDEKPQQTKIKTRNVFSVLVNANDQLLVRGEPVNINVLREKAKEFIKNPLKLENMSESPKKAIISLKNDRGTHYYKYLAVYNELKAAYNELRDEEAMKRYGKKMEDLPRDKQKLIMNDIPLILSEAESTNFGEE
ncbi:MAG TPA: biopolymer transporter ExbD [Bacteroidetes bacterium]|nr:biopolymer transporter ExbD [Bacteroidota bacterium]